MATTEQSHAEELAQQGEPCPTCGNPMAADQRYCLNCGVRRGDSRVDFDELVGGSAGGVAPPPVGPAALRLRRSAPTTSRRWARSSGWPCSGRCS